MASIVFALFAPPGTRAGGLPEAAPAITPGAERAPRPGAMEPAEEFGEEPDFPPDDYEPGFEEFRLPGEEPPAPLEKRAARLWILPVFLGAAAAVLLAARILRGRE